MTDDEVDATAAGRTEEASRITVAGAVRWNGDRARPRRVGCFENGQRAAGTRRVQSESTTGHVRALAAHR